MEPKKGLKGCKLYGIYGENFRCKERKPANFLRKSGCIPVNLKKQEILRRGLRQKPSKIKGFIFNVNYVNQLLLKK